MSLDAAEFYMGLLSDPPNRIYTEEEILIAMHEAMKSSHFFPMPSQILSVLRKRRFEIEQEKIEQDRVTKKPVPLLQIYNDMKDRGEIT